MDGQIANCIRERVLAGDIEEGDTCEDCEFCQQYDVFGGTGIGGKIGAAKYCEKGLWKEEV